MQILIVEKGPPFVREAVGCAIYEWIKDLAKGGGAVECQIDLTKRAKKRKYPAGKSKPSLRSNVIRVREKQTAEKMPKTGSA
jgi:hypothetical protein